MKINNNDKILLFIEPKNQKSSEPIIDEYTIKMFNALADNDNSIGYVSTESIFVKDRMLKGLHTCVCGVKSNPCDYLLYDKIATNWLCVHYLTYHRDEVPEDELRKVSQLESSNILHPNLMKYLKR